MQFWQALNMLKKIYFCIGIGATVFLILQIITLLFGFGDSAEVDVGSGDVDVDFDVGDADVDADFSSDSGDSIEVADGFNLFTLRGMIAFFAIGGWTGYALAEISTFVAILGSLIAGSLALVVMAFMMRGIMRLRSSGNIEISKAVGSIADVYLTIPAKNDGCGKINLTLEERYVELNAIQNGETPIPTGSKVKIVGVLGDALVVESL